MDGAVCPWGCWCCRRGRNVASRGEQVALGAAWACCLVRSVPVHQARLCCVSCNYAGSFKVVEISVLKWTWENLNLAQRGSSSMSHLQLWSSPGQSLPLLCWKDLSGCWETGQGEKIPSSFPNEVCMGEFPTGTPVGVCGSVFFNPSAPHKNVVQLGALTWSTETPWAHPQEADNSADVPLAAEEVASVKTNKQSAKVHGLAVARINLTWNYLASLAFVLLSGDVSLPPPPPS